MLSNLHILLPHEAVFYQIAAFLGAKIQYLLTGRILADSILAADQNKIGRSNNTGTTKMLDNAKKVIGAVTELGIALLALAIVASLLVGQSNMSFLGDVVGNITGLVQQLGSAGLAGLISLGVVLWLFQRR